MMMLNGACLALYFFGFFLLRQGLLFKNGILGHTTLPK